MAIDAENISSPGAPTTEQSPHLREIVQNTPLPEIVIPEALLVERERAITNLIKNPPKVDAMLVLGRSGTLAATGLYEDAERTGRLGLPKLLPIEGIGREVWAEYRAYMNGRPDDPELEAAVAIGGWGDEENAESFNQWIKDTDNVHIRAVIARLGELQAKHRFGSVAILDDVTQYGVVTNGVAPALFNKAFGEGVSYDKDSNRMLFSEHVGLNWLPNIIRSTFGSSWASLSKEQVDFLVDVAKGGQDFQEDTILSGGSRDRNALNALVTFHTEHAADADRAIQTNSLNTIINVYGDNLFDLQHTLRDKLRSHTEQILAKLEDKK